MTNKNQLLKRIFDGVPSIIIDKGKINRCEMARARMSLEELLGELRLNSVSDPSDVDYAILEKNGRLSIVLKPEARPATLGDLNISVERRGFAHPIVVDGRLSRKNLAFCGLDDKWLTLVLRRSKCELRDIFLLTVDDSGKTFIVKRNEV